MLSTLDAVWRDKFPTVNCAVFYLLHTPSTRTTSGNRKIDKEKLIIEVEKKPEMYDPSSKFYKYINRKEACWRDIARVLQVSAK